MQTIFNYSNYSRFSKFEPLYANARPFPVAFLCIDHLPPSPKKLLGISGDSTWDRTFFVLCAYTKHALNVTECSCRVMIGHTISMHCLCFYLLFSLFSQKELKYRHEVVSVEQINKKIGIQ